MTPVVITLVFGALTIAGLFLLTVTGIRNGDRPGDARVSVEPWTSGQPDERRPVLIATIENPSPVPVMAGLTARRARIPDWLAPGGVTVPLRTTRRGLRPGHCDTVGIVPASGTARFTVPVERAARRYHLTAVIGQRDGRLRLYRIVVAVQLLPAARARRPASRR